MKNLRKIVYALVLIVLLILSVMSIASAQVEVPMAVYGYVFVHRDGENVTAPAGLWVYAKYAADVVDKDTTSSEGAYDLTIAGPPSGASIDLWVEETHVTTIILQYMTTLQLNLTVMDTILGDVNGDGVVDIYDVVTVAVAFGSIPGDSNWNPLADLNNDDVVDIYDVVTIARNFGKTA